MTTIIYKKLLERYVIDAMHESEGDGVTLTLCEPIDARIVIGEEIYQVKKGISKLSGIPEGLIQPKLYTGTALYELERFVYKNGTAILSRDPGDFAADALLILDSMETRIRALEGVCAELSDKISRRISILGYSENETTKENQ